MGDIEILIVGNPDKRGVILTLTDTKTGDVETHEFPQLVAAVNWMKRACDSVRICGPSEPRLTESPQFWPTPKQG